MVLASTELASCTGGSNSSVRSRTSLIACRCQDKTVVMNSNGTNWTTREIRRLTVHFPLG